MNRSSEKLVTVMLHDNGSYYPDMPCFTQAQSHCYTKCEQETHLSDTFQQSCWGNTICSKPSIECINETLAGISL